MLNLENRAHTFTGQGSQRPDMFEGLEQSPEAWKIIETANGIIGFSLFGLSPEDLNQTKYVQPAIVACDMALLAATRELHPDLPEPAFDLGHSVGEYCALVDAGVIDTETALYLVEQRGLLMELLSPEGRMAALLGFENQEQVAEICKQTGTEEANFNGPTQIVISGGFSEMRNAMEMAKEAGMRVVLLKASHPFHSSLMQPVQDEFRKTITNIEFKEPKIPVISNITARPFQCADEIKLSLIKQIVMPVRWADSIRVAKERGVNTFLEFGPKPILTGLLNKIAPEANGFCVYDYISAQALAVEV